MSIFVLGIDLGKNVCGLVGLDDVAMALWALSPKWSRALWRWKPAAARITLGWLGISKRGNRYLRANLIHGARAVLPRIMAQYTPLGRFSVDQSIGTALVKPHDPVADDLHRHAAEASGL